MLGGYKFDFDEWIKRYPNENFVDTHHRFLSSFVFGWIGEDQNCDGDKDQLSKYAALLVVERDWNNAQIPIFDMFSHQTG